MITGKIENIGKYATLFTGIDTFLNLVSTLEKIVVKEVHGNISLIPLKSDCVSKSFNPNLLEAHKKLMDIHVTLEGTDVIAYADLENETSITKLYNEDQDYLLAESTKIKTLTVPAGYFCIIPNHFAHMALYQGHSDVRKIVVKIPVI